MNCLKKSITLIEILIAMGIFVIVISLFNPITGINRSAWLISQAKMHLYMQAQKAISQISLEFLNSRPTTLYISEDNSNMR
ncbi:MAG: type II secretion system GspH family protein, partial [Candidatus Omnitrophica bacterium]|nr:type II secretion system GspH family protein [Candidatus Omnitrophota bacterium]